MVTKPRPSLDVEYGKAQGILKASFRFHRMSRTQAGFVLGTLDKLYKAVQKERPQEHS